MKVSPIERLPRAARDLIDAALDQGGFSGYVELAEKFKGFGKGISKSSLHRYGQKRKALLARAKFEAAVMENMSGDAAFLVRWAHAEPRAAARLVKRLQAKGGV